MAEAKTTKRKPRRLEGEVKVTPRMLSTALGGLTGKAAEALKDRILKLSETEERKKRK